MKMHNFTKRQLQKKVLQFGNFLDLNKFSYEKANKYRLLTFNSKEPYLVCDFSLAPMNINVGNDCYVKVNNRCNIQTGANCIIEGDNFMTSSFIQAGDNSLIIGGSDCLVRVGANCFYKNKNTKEIFALPVNQLTRIL